MLKLMLRRDIGIQAKLECIKFYFTAYGFRALFATLPRSGYNYATLIINTAWDMAHGGAGEYDYQGGKWRTRHPLQTPMDWRTPLTFATRAEWDGPVIFHTHLPYHKVATFQKKRMKAVVLVRNIIDQLESEMFHEGYDASTQDEYLNAGAVDRSIDFFNSWGAFLDRNDRSRLLRYEDIVRHPYEAIESLSAFWGLGLPGECVRRAVKACSRTEMIKRISCEERMTNPRVSVTMERGKFSEANIRSIKSRIADRLRYPLGYDYKGR